MADQEPQSHIPDPPAVRPIHGGVRPAQIRSLGLRPEQVLDFSASVSPIGPPEGVWDALRKVDLASYPDPQCLELRESLCCHLSKAVSPEHILVGNGSTEIIHLLARAYLSPPRAGTVNTMLQLTPTYGEYEGACRLAGAVTSNAAAKPCPWFRWDMAEVASQVTRERPSLVFLCNPNNPTGVFLDSREIETLAQAVAATGGLLVIDEAYISFVEDAWDSLGLALGSNVVMVRSMTKDYALTGLRLGYALASEQIIARLAAFQPDWSVNGLAQAAGLVALADTNYLSRARKAVTQAKEFLADRLAGLGLTVHPSSANFLLVNVGDGGFWHDNLMRRGIFVRDCTSFGLPEHIRVGVRSLDDCRRLVEAMEEIFLLAEPRQGG